MADGKGPSTKTQCQGKSADKSCKLTMEAYPIHAFVTLEGAPLKDIIKPENIGKIPGLDQTVVDSFKNGKLTMGFYPPSPHDALVGDRRGMMQDDSKDAVAKRDWFQRNVPMNLPHFSETHDVCSDQLKRALMMMLHYNATGHWIPFLDDCFGAMGNIAEAAGIQPPKEDPPWVRFPHMR
jgi:hypothetical protein